MSLPVKVKLQQLSVFPDVQAKNVKVVVTEVQMWSQFSVIALGYL